MPLSSGLLFRVATNEIPIVRQPSWNRCDTNWAPPHRGCPGFRDYERVRGDHKAKVALSQETLVGNALPKLL